MVGDEVNAEDQRRWLADAGELERIAYVRTERWITYPRAAAILDQMQRLLDHPRNSRMPSLLIIGEAGIGKTQLLSDAAVVTALESEQRQEIGFAIAVDQAVVERDIRMAPCNELRAGDRGENGARPSTVAYMSSDRNRSVANRS
jgi:hypothetical protein